jgi:hypothetical protein
MLIEYCERWVFLKKTTAGLLDEETARKRHENRLPYTALIGGKEDPDFVVSIGGEFVLVSFMDGQTRESLRYDFKEVRPSKLFLSRALHRTYDEDTDEILRVMTFVFHEDGRILMEEHDLKTDSVQEREAVDSVAENGDDYPEFGHYERLCRRDRGILR